MKTGIRRHALPALIIAASLAIHASVAPQSQVAEIQFQIGQEFFVEGRYFEALEAYQKAVEASDPSDARAARSGVIMSALRVAEFDLARTQADALLKAAPRDPEALALHGDTLWSVGLFEEAEQRYRETLAANTDSARGHHGLARALAAYSRLEDAMDEAQTAVQLSPLDMEIHHTLGMIYERMGRFGEAVAAFSNYVNLLPNKDRSDQADWARSEVTFLRAFGQRVPFEMEPGAEEQQYTIPFRLVKDKIVVRAKVNNGSFQDFVVDTGAEKTILTKRVARRVGVTPIAHTLSAGVGEIRLRGLQLARIDSLQIGLLKLWNVPCIIKDPPLRSLPSEETESLSPLALGLSMVVDYKTRMLTLGKRLKPEPATFELPLRMHRLAMVRGLVGGVYPASFVVDTGGEVISISQTTAAALNRPPTARRIGLLVYGSSGWDKDAFLLPGVDLAFSELRFPNSSVVVLNLDIPSALLGFQLGGIVGYDFLGKYRVGFDLQRSVLRLQKI